MYLSKKALELNYYLGGSSSRFGDVFDVHRFSFHPSHLGQIHPLLNESFKMTHRKKFEKNAFDDIVG